MELGSKQILFVVLREQRSEEKHFREPGRKIIFLSRGMDAKTPTPTPKVCSKYTFTGLYAMF